MTAKAVGIDLGTFFFSDFVFQQALLNADVGNATKIALLTSCFVACFPFAFPVGAHDDGMAWAGTLPFASHSHLNDFANHQ